MDNVIAEDCLTCGEIMIRSIDQPFVPKDKLPAFLQSWSLGTQPSLGHSANPM